VVSGEHVDVKTRQRHAGRQYSGRTFVHNIEIKIGKGGQIARSAALTADRRPRRRICDLAMNSGEQRLVHGRCIATVGAVSNRTT